MKFIVDRASDSASVKPKEIKIWTLKGLYEFIKENGPIILKEEEIRVEKYEWEKLSCNRYYEWEKTWRIRLTIYDDYVE